MPSYTVKIKADLENIKQLIPLTDNTWKFNIQSTDGCDKKEGITVSKSDVIPLEGSRGEAHFVMKWPGSKTQAYMKIIDLKGVSGNYAEDQTGEWVAILGLECRGLEPVAWIPEMDFVAETSGGHYFEEVDLSSKDWAEYDEDNDLSVSVMNVECKIE